MVKETVSPEARPKAYVPRRRRAQVKPFSDLATEVERWLGFAFFVAVLGYLLLVPVIYPFAGEMDLGLIKALPFYEMIFLGFLLYIEIATRDPRFVNKIQARELAGIPLLLCAGATFVYLKIFEIDIFSTETMLAASLPVFQAIVLFVKFKLSGVGVTWDTLRMPVVLSVFGWIVAILATYGATMNTQGLMFFGAMFLIGIWISSALFISNLIGRLNLLKKILRCFRVPYYNVKGSKRVVLITAFGGGVLCVGLFLAFSFALYSLGLISGLGQETVIQLVALFSIMFPAALLSFPQLK